MPLLNGYVALHRSLLNWGWHDDPATGWLFVNLILLASHTATEWRGVTIQRGQLVTGRKALVMQTGLTERQIRTALEHLKTTGEVTIKTTNKFSLITVVNYEKFQGNGKKPTSKMTKSTTSRRPTDDQQPTTSEEDSEYKESKNVLGTRKRFIPPTVEEVLAYCDERGNTVSAQRFIDHYTANGWRVGKNPMKDWRAAVRSWEQREKEGGFAPNPTHAAPKPSNGLHAIPTAADYTDGVDPSGFGWA